MAGDVAFPDNDFTRMIEATASGNRSGVRGAGVASASPMPTAQSADLGREVTTPPPLTPEENAELNRLAVEAGVRDPRLGSPDEGGSTYGTLAEAMAAGAPVIPPPLVERVPSGVQRALANRVVSQPRLPNFSNVEGFDLIRNVIVVDGMEFPLAPEDARDFKMFAVEHAREAIMEKLNEAAGLFATPETAEVTNGGSAPTEEPKVQSQSERRSSEPTL